MNINQNLNLLQQSLDKPNESIATNPFESGLVRQSSNPLYMNDTVESSIMQDLENLNNL